MKSNSSEGEVPKGRWPEKKIQNFFMRTHEKIKWSLKMEFGIEIEKNGISLSNIPAMSYYLTLFCAEEQKREILLQGAHRHNGIRRFRITDPNHTLECSGSNPDTYFGCAADQHKPGVRPRSPRWNN